MAFNYIIIRLNFFIPSGVICDQIWEKQAKCTRNFAEKIFTNPKWSDPIWENNQAQCTKHFTKIITLKKVL